MTPERSDVRTLPTPDRPCGGGRPAHRGGRSRLLTRTACPNTAMRGPRREGAPTTGIRGDALASSWPRSTNGRREEAARLHSRSPSRPGNSEPTAEDICEALGAGTESRHVEGVRGRSNASEPARRLAEHPLRRTGGGWRNRIRGPPWGRDKETLAKNSASHSLGSTSCRANRKHSGGWRDSSPVQGSARRREVE